MRYDESTACSCPELRSPARHWVLTCLLAATVAWAGCSGEESPAGQKLQRGEGPDAGANGDLGEPAADTGDGPVGLGKVCRVAADCESGWCIPYGGVRVCTRPCNDDCEGDWLCRGLTDRNGDVAFVCMPPDDLLCSSCSVDRDCGEGLCWAFDPESGSRSCVQPCVEGSCREGFICQHLPGGGQVQGEFCLPASGTCSCTPANEGMDRLCQVRNAHGACLGREVCVATEGWTGCTADSPQPEACNGRDDDCNGIVDDVEGLGAACTRDAELPDGPRSCPGVLLCVDGDPALRCSAPMPVAEECNLADDDCNGVVDDGFRDPESGLYLTAEHCGLCGYSCAGTIPFAAELRCAAVDGVPSCVVESCEPGYFRAGDFACLAVSSHPCSPCRDDAACPVLGDRCLPLDGQQICGQDCSAGNLRGLPPGECPEGYDCTALGDGVAQCLPRSGSCTCLAEHAGDTRWCTLTSEHGTCTGFDTCDPLLGWVGCTAAVPVVESCNGVDDDCDGAIDEDFALLHQPCRVGEGACLRAGVHVCSPDGAGVVCSAQPGGPQVETCNYADDDCDGATDEDFRDLLTGQYDRLEHCGACNSGCEGRVLFAARLVCSLEGEAPACLVTECEPGFVVAGRGRLCVPESGASDCSPCYEDLNCELLEGGRCESFPDGTFCTRGCTTDADCLGSYGCQGGRCLPTTGSCSCLAASDGAVRACHRSNEHGTCTGSQTCDALASPGWSECSAPVPAAEICDGVDNDCNGLGDEGLAHPDGPACEQRNDWGVCRGFWFCSGAAGWTCSAAVPAEERCNGLDDDCDGAIDEDFPDLQRPCFAGEGACRTAGVHRCLPDGSGAACMAVPGDPVAESCDGVDNDCDGATDEDFAGLDQACAVGEGSCRAIGVVRCSADGARTECSARPGEPRAETCDGRDDDCDGLIDEDFPELEQPCHAGVGACRAVGMAVCDEQGDGTVCLARAGEPVAELCDGLDNDCDGETDEDFPGLNTACEVGLGICRMGGLIRCSADGASAGCSAHAGLPAAESCNGLDDDCDGETDEDFLVGGKVALLEHCGTCGRSCVGAIANGTARCAAELAQPACVVDRCDPGYTAVGLDRCLPVGLGQCDPCLEDEDCLFPGASCTALADGMFCLDPCQEEGDCPAGTTCTDTGPAGGGRFCLPATGSCLCDGTDLTLKRGCEQGYEPGGGRPGYTCFGVQSCQPGGWSACVLSGEVCNDFDDDCDGLTDEDFFDAWGRLSSNEHCGQCGNDCTLLVYPGGGHVCDATVDPPRCVATCRANCFDVDEHPGNGCECCDPVPLDLPDPAGVDSNCDGIDGERDNGIFVAKNGDDGNDGSYGHPRRTVQAGVAAARARHKRDVYVATGVYEETVELVAGVGVYGGYSSDFRVRNTLLYETALLSPAPVPGRPGGVNAIDLRGGAAGSTVLDGFTVLGYPTPPPGESSYAIYVRDCDATLRLAHNRVQGGIGGRGSRGSDGSDGSDGVAGSPGLPALEVGGQACNLAPRAGGAGGSFACPGGGDTSGGRGGNRACPTWNGSVTGVPGASERGAPGAGGGGAGGAAGRDVYHQSYNCMGYETFGDVEGEEGLDGPAGTDGAAGPTCADAGGRVVGGLWQPLSAGDGGHGGDGKGGGGGGSGAGAYVHNSCHSHGYGWHNVGATGGGGGSGACGATAGTAGTGGGGAFGVFLVFTAPPASVPAITGNGFFGGMGGVGGDGGNGGTGGAAGAGALGGAGGGDPVPPDPTYPAFQGGKGGNGGNGGHGGGGGGGCGGPAFDIYVWNPGAADLAPYREGNSFLRPGTGGPGGAGGFSLGNPGEPGAAGAAGRTNF